ncbi:hypothetical protein J2S34_002309 [Nitrobacter winogradskyi]|uniref:Uncharacterized protein n=1 Tax=Nitrobacter winogradskyi TaxID=913 RepID=A0ACC6AJL6_NITWI|nr:hypothetical protein [Nitrobacter winogradskyi]
MAPHQTESHLWVRDLVSRAYMIAGDVSRDVLLVAAAIAEGARAAVAINKAFLRRDGFCD